MRKELKKTLKNAIQSVIPPMRGIDISNRYFWEIGLPAIEAELPAYVDCMAAGLIAPETRIIAQDDHASTRQFSLPGFQIYLVEDDFAAVGADLQVLLDELPNSRGNRVYSIDEFFLDMTSLGNRPGFEYAPDSLQDWLRIPESGLFSLSDGQIFYDPLGEFSERRKDFSSYPDEVWRMKLDCISSEWSQLAERLSADSPVYRDHFATEMVWWRFAESTMRLGFILNRRYAPSQERLYDEFCRLPGLSYTVANLLWDGQCAVGRRPGIVSEIASVYTSSIVDKGLVESGSEVFGLSTSSESQVFPLFVSPDAIDPFECGAW